MTYDPWSLLRSLPHIRLRWEASPDVLGTWCQETREIVMHPRQSQRQKRCTLTHELIHAERGDDGACDERTESAVHSQAARRLIPIEDLAEAILIHDHDRQAIADHLWVDMETLETRLARLHPAERGYLWRRMSMKEQTA